VSTADNSPDTSPSSKGRKGGGGSKAWIAGAVIGPILGLALIGALVWFFLRRRKNKGTAPQQGSAAMTPVNPSHPPVGVGGFTDAKPQFAQPQQPHPNQSAYGAQQGCASPPLSPIHQYQNGVAPYNAPGCPPPQQSYHANDAKQGYTGAPMGGASELGGDSIGTTASGALTATNMHNTELGGMSTQVGAPAHLGPSELPATSSPSGPAA
jgi:LPXTG-motif cell wall-anchored protein